MQSDITHLHPIHLILPLKSISFECLLLNRSLSFARTLFPSPPLLSLTKPVSKQSEMRPHHNSVLHKLLHAIYCTSRSRFSPLIILLAPGPSPPFVNCVYAFGIEDWLGMVNMRIQRPSMRSKLTVLKDCEPPDTWAMARVQPWVGRTEPVERGIPVDLVLERCGLEHADGKSGRRSMHRRRTAGKMFVSCSVRERKRGGRKEKAVERHDQTNGQRRTPDSHAALATPTRGHRSTGSDPAAPAP